VRSALVLLILIAASVCCVGSSFASPRDPVAFWSQIQDFSDGFHQAYSSEYRTSDGYLCESADDFYSESGDTIVRVDWWGQERDLPGGEAVPEIDEFIIRFCEDDTTARYHFPGTIVYEEHVFDFTTEYIGITEKYYYSCDIPGRFAPAPGERYWVSILAVHAFPNANQQWYRYNCLQEEWWGAEATYKSDFWGAPVWIPWSSRPYWNPFEHAFILYSRGDTPVEDKSWAEIKAMYR